MSERVLPAQVRPLTLDELFAGVPPPVVLNGMPEVLREPLHTAWAALRQSLDLYQPGSLAFVQLQPGTLDVCFAPRAEVLRLLRGLPPDSVRSTLAAVEAGEASGQIRFVVWDDRGPVGRSCTFRLLAFGRQGAQA